MKEGQSVLLCLNDRLMSVERIIIVIINLQMSYDTHISCSTWDGHCWIAESKAPTLGNDWLICWFKAIAKLSCEIIRIGSGVVWHTVAWLGIFKQAEVTVRTSSCALLSLFQTVTAYPWLFFSYRCMWKMAISTSGERWQFSFISSHLRLILDSWDCVGWITHLLPNGCLTMSLKNP